MLEKSSFLKFLSSFSREESAKRKKFNLIQNKKKKKKWEARVLNVYFMATYRQEQSEISTVRFVFQSNFFPNTPTFHNLVHLSAYKSIRSLFPLSNLKDEQKKKKRRRKKSEKKNSHTERVKEWSVWRDNKEASKQAAGRQSGTHNKNKNKLQRLSSWRRLMLMVYGWERRKMLCREERGKKSEKIFVKIVHE